MRYRNDLGCDSFLLWPVNADSEDQTARFVEHVAPHVRTATPEGIR
ncbi:hypothetical protein ABZ348_24325 [Streptomyces sp. NPDC005963]